METKKIILESFNELCDESWIYLTPTVHGLLEHAPELIDANNGEGLGAFTESSLECNNKILRLIRISQSCKCSQIDNLDDCLNRFGVQSDIHVRKAVPSKRAFKKTDSFQGFFHFHHYQNIIAKNLL